MQTCHFEIVHFIHLLFLFLSHEDEVYVKESMHWKSIIFIQFTCLLLFSLDFFKAFHGFNRSRFSFSFCQMSFRYICHRYNYWHAIVHNFCFQGVSHSFFLLSSILIKENKVPVICLLCCSGGQAQGLSTDKHTHTIRI